MRDRPLKLWLVSAAMAILLPCGAHAAGLGRLTVQSGLGQVLNAEIELLAVKRGETITARLAPPEVYQQANAQFNQALVGTRITVEKRPNGDLYLKASTPRPIQEPFIELIVELNSESGRVTRQYTALLDPPGYGRAAGEIPPRAEPPPAAVAVAPEAPEATAESSPETTPPAAPVAPPPDATARAPAAPKAAPPTPAAGATPGQYGPIKPGETLRGIARVVKPEGVTVEQTLVALHRQNPDAFIRKNMNLVKSGKILKIPDANDIATVTQPEALREVRVQVADFNAFRERLAERVPAATEEGSATRGRIGSITTDLASAAPRDTVRVSPGEPSGKAAASAKGSAEERIRTLEEEAVARQRALAEATERIGQLEKTIKDMQRLAELKTTGAAAGTKSPESGTAKAPADTKAAPSAGTIASQRIEPIKGPSGASGPAGELARPSPESGGASTPGAPPGVPATAPNEVPGGPLAALPPKGAPPKAAPVPEPKSEPSSSFMDDLLADPTYLGLGAAVILLGLLGLMAARRRRAARDYPTDEDKIAPIFTNRSSLVPPGGGARPSTTAAAGGGPSPKAADTRAPQAPGVTHAAATPRPRGSTTDNDLDFDLSPQGRGSATSTTSHATASPEMKQTVSAAESRKKETAPPAGPVSSLLAGASVAREPATQQASPATAAASPGTGSRVYEPRASQAVAAPDASKPQPADFSLAPPAPTAESSRASNLLDFDLDSAPPVRPTIDPAVGERVSSEPPPRDFEFKLDLEGLDLPTPGEGRMDAAPKDAHWYDVQQKFDLAKAYQEMGDRDGARDILREVLKEGDQDQRTQATQLIAKLG